MSDETRGRGGVEVLEPGAELRREEAATAASRSAMLLSAAPGGAPEGEVVDQQVWLGANLIFQLEARRYEQGSIPDHFESESGWLGPRSSAIR